MPFNIGPGELILILVIALVVLGPGNRITGIISERDIVRNVASGGIKALDEPVGQAMTQSPQYMHFSRSMSKRLGRSLPASFFSPSIQKQSIGQAFAQAGYRPSSSRS